MSSLLPEEHLKQKRFGFFPDGTNDVNPTGLYVYFDDALVAVQKAREEGRKIGIEEEARNCSKYYRGKLKAVKLSRAEYLTAEARKEHNLPDEGMVAIETREYETLEELKASVRKQTAEEIFEKLDSNFKKKSFTPAWVFRMDNGEYEPTQWYYNLKRHFLSLRGQSDSDTK